MMRPLLQLTRCGLADSGATMLPGLPCLPYVFICLTDLLAAGAS